MGQYYRIFMCEEDGSNPRVHSPHDHDNNGAKLMEHSYYYNRFVEAACSQLFKTYRLTTHEYIDLKKVYSLNNGNIHPLPLLTAVGNGRGGGDYHGNGVTNLNMVGIWAGDLLQIVEQVPKDDFLDYIDISEDAHFAER